MPLAPGPLLSSPPMRRAALLLAVVLAGCGRGPAGPSPTATTDGLTAAEDSALVLRLAQYATAALDPDLEGLSDSVRLALPHLVEAARALDGVFAAQTGAPDSLPFGEAARRYLAINYGPWDRLDGDAPFLPGVGSKPPGAGFYPPDLEEAALLATADLYPELGLTSRTTLVRRDGDSLVGVRYHDAFADAHRAAAGHLRAAAAVVPDSALARAWRLRAGALEDGDAARADSAQAALEGPVLDVIAGPAETFEDGLAGRKAAHAGVVLVRARGWAERAARADSLLRADSLDTASRPRVEVADAAVLAGQANAGPKPLSVDLPAGAGRPARRVVLRNVAAAKADRVLAPIAALLVAPDQRGRVTADAFVAHAVWHEVAHGPAPSPALGEAAADARALLLAARLADLEADDPDAGADALEAAAVTYVASVFRAVRFGAAGPRGRAHLVVLNRLRDAGALEAMDGLWRVDVARVGPALEALLADLEAVPDADAFVQRWGRTTDALVRSLDALETAGVPADVVFEAEPPPASR